MQPWLGPVADFASKGKLSVSYARFLETPIPLDLNVRAGGGNSGLGSSGSATVSVEICRVMARIG